jgi:hypothetical protein
VLTDREYFSEHLGVHVREPRQARCIGSATYV